MTTFHLKSREDSPEKHYEILSTIVVTNSIANFAIPDKATSMKIILVGAGGGGGNTDGVTGGGGGGGGGTFIENNFDVVAGEKINISIGYGGKAGTLIGEDGQDGQDTSLTYRSYLKLANGGKGGGGVVNKFVGGAGGIAAGLGSDGNNGTSNVSAQQRSKGGVGGLSGLLEAGSYGSGGHGKDVVSLPNLPGEIKTADVINPTISHRIGTTTISSRSTPFNIFSPVNPFNQKQLIDLSGFPKPIIQREIPFRPHNSGFSMTTSTASLAKSSESKISVSGDSYISYDNGLNPYAIKYYFSGSNLPPKDDRSYDGSDGYAKLVFYTSSSYREQERKSKRVQELIPESSKPTYYVNPNVPVTLVNTSNHSVNIALPRPDAKYKKVTIKLSNPAGMDAYIIPHSGGTFTLSSSNPSITLVFDKNVWSIEGNSRGVNSFYVTTLDDTPLLPINYVNTPGSLIFNVPSGDISARGNVLVVGYQDDNNNIGSAFVYKLKNDSWMEEAKLIGNSSMGSTILQGLSVAISANGKTIVSSGPLDHSNTGAVWLFEHKDSAWDLTGTKIINSNGTALNYFGYSTDLSADGKTLVVGEPGTSSGGGIWIYNKMGDGPWIQGQLLTGNKVVSGDGFGYAVTISADGNTIAAASLNDSVYIFRKVMGTWSQDGDVIMGPTNSLTGYSLSLSADGLTLAFGLPNFPPGYGSTGIFTRYFGVWTYQSLLIVPTDRLSVQGLTVSLTADGNNLAMGGFVGNPNEGNTFTWTRVNNIWNRTTKLDHETISEFTLDGLAAAYSSDGSSLLTLGFRTSVNNPGYIRVYN